MGSHIGIIPARAGFTDAAYVYGVATRGSSPLARGLRDSGLGIHFRFRIIPARAGFTGERRRPAAGRQDHPRSRGVYGGESTCAWLPHGSSPLARGLPPGCGRELSSRGIIPARAGFTGK